MRASVALLIAPLMALLALGCGDDESQPPSGSSGGAGGGCPDSLCGAVACADGFQADDYGCVPILPAEPCPGITMALPGDDSCGAIAACGDAPWGDVVTQADTVYVDGSFSGGGPDGTSSAPFTTIGEALLAAAPGAIVAVAEGAYSESLQLTRPVTLWGRCAALVSIQPLDAFSPVLVADATSAGSAIRGVALEGTLELNASADIEQTVVRQAPAGGIFALVAGSQINVRRSILEDNAIHSMVVFDGALTIEDSVVRADGAKSFGPAVLNTTAVRATPSLTVRHSVFEGLTAYGAVMIGAPLSMETSAIRNIRPDGSELGDGIVVAATDSGVSGSGHVIDTYVGNVARAGVANFLSDATLERVRLECNSIHLNGETMLPGSSLTRAYTFDDAGDNRCGCGEEREACNVLSSGLSPPMLGP